MRFPSLQTAEDGAWEWKPTPNVNVVGRQRWELGPTISPELVPKGGWGNTPKKAKPVPRGGAGAESAESCSAPMKEWTTPEGKHENPSHTGRPGKSLSSPVLAFRCNQRMSASMHDAERYAGMQCRRWLGDFPDQTPSPEAGHSAASEPRAPSQTAWLGSSPPTRCTSAARATAVTGCLGRAPGAAAAAATAKLGQREQQAGGGLGGHSPYCTCIR